MMMTVLAGCSDGGGENPIEPTPQPEKTEIIIDAGIVANGLSLGASEGEQSISFSCYTYNPIILGGNWIFPFSRLTLGI